MLRMFWTSKSAMNANQQKLDAISNNIANVNTEGYKRVDVTFKDLVSESLERQGYPMTQGGNRSQTPFTGTGVKTGNWIRDNSQGNFLSTEKSSDLAIEGQGYFRMVRADGSYVYSRSGNFNADENGRLVDGKGNILYIDFNEGNSYDNVRLSKDNFVIDKDGLITIKNGDDHVTVGRVPIFDAEGQDAFTSIGDSLYVAKDGVNLYENGDANIFQGIIEVSNVNMVTEFSDMIMTQRAFELNSKGLRVADEMWGMANNLRGR